MAALPPFARVPRSTQWAAVALVASAVTLLGGCDRSPAPTTSTPAAHTASPYPNLSAAEIRFGVSPTRNKDVAYQPDVIIMEHGADAIRSYSADGMTWTFDAGAPHAAEIQPGRILFATGRAVGRVLAVERKGSDLDVTLGPVELTDVIEEVHISYHGALDPETMISYYAPDYPGTSVDLSVPTRTSMLGEDRRGTAPTAWWTDVDPDQFRVRQVGSVPAGGGGKIGPLEEFGIGEFNFVPNCCGGLGVKQRYKKDGLDFTASAQLILNHPEFSFHLDIAHGLKTAEIELTGVGGILVDFRGTTNAEFAQIDRAFALPVDLSFPIGGIAVPFSATFRQSFLIKTAFTAKQAGLHAVGEYELGGTIKAGYSNGQLSVTTPLFGRTKQNLAQSIDGVSAGVNALILGYGGKLIVGLGAFGLAVGPYVSVNTTVGTTRGSDTQVPIVGYTCRTAQFKMWVDYGVGYAIPNVVVQALNTFLSLFHAAPISQSSDYSLGSKPIYYLSEGVPPSCDTP